MSQNLIRKICAGLLLTAFIPVAAETQWNGAASCERAYVQSMTSLRIRYDNWAIADSLYHQLCSKSNRSRSGEFEMGSKSLIDAVPGFGVFLSGTMKANSNKEFCDTYDQRRNEFRTSMEYDVSPLDQAQRNFNECMKIATSGSVIVSHFADPVTLSVFFDLRDNRPLHISSVRAPGATCYVPGGGPNGDNLFFSDEHAVAHDLVDDGSIICKRDGNKVVDGTSYETVYLTIATGSGNYTVTWRDDIVESPATHRESALIIKELRNRADNAERRLGGATLTLHKYYVHEGDIRTTFVHPMYGTLYPSNSQEWNQMKGEPWRKRVDAAICPDAEKVVTEQTYIASGGAIGHNFFARACLDIPD